MITAEIVNQNGTQIVKLPPEIHFPGNKVVLRRQGEAVVMEPLKPTAWPEGFFENIHIEDPAFTRPEQGQMPPAPSLE